ncbi:sperm flagellar protein 1 isoform X1 [Mesoplodon densirostris]|uniref:sperm flagellar protein 1 isoform X1 n=1 Tax=Mesoplodon densirostris TaxID=48708 RepID=UPI0028DB90FF|nr:sperm flagellar protein 1 isoform X1 [Mesoplodon densirostris]
MRKIAQCAPGVVELVLIPLRQCLEEQQRRRKQGTSSLQELAPQDGTDYMDVGLSQKARGKGAPDPQGGGQLRVGRLPVPRPLGYSQARQVDRSLILQIAEKEQELLASQETVQVLQMKVRRLEHLLQLKNVRIEDLSRRLQQAEHKQRRMDCFPEPRSHMQRPGMHPKAVPDTRGGSMLPVLGLGRWSPSSVHTPRTRSPPSSDDSSVSIQASPLYPGPKGKLSQTAEGLPCPSLALTWDPTGGWKVQQLKRKG